MGGHLDDAEHNLEKPIVSFSIGSAAVFLIGGPTKDISPIPIVLRSGDALIMSGESRCCYHGVGGILPNNFEEELIGLQNPFNDLAAQLQEGKLNELYEGFENLEDLKHLTEYLMHNRVNLNARQVLKSDGENAWIEKAGTGFVKYTKLDQIR